MTPKDKALALYKYYEQLARDFTRGVSMIEFAKICATKAVNEIIIEREVIYASLGITPGEFWKDVKREIEAL
jgi:fructose-1,6-bisphosphatase/sedoheptulose 1,7-bisphosphatase-like protein